MKTDLEVQQYIPQLVLCMYQVPGSKLLARNKRELTKDACMRTTKKQYMLYTRNSTRFNTHCARTPHCRSGWGGGTTFALQRRRSSGLLLYIKIWRKRDNAWCPEKKRQTKQKASSGSPGYHSGQRTSSTSQRSHHHITLHQHRVFVVCSLKSKTLAVAHHLSAMISY